MANKLQTARAEWQLSIVTITTSQSFLQLFPKSVTRSLYQAAKQLDNGKAPILGNMFIGEILQMPLYNRKKVAYLFTAGLMFFQPAIFVPIF